MSKIYRSTRMHNGTVNTIITPDLFREQCREIVPVLGNLTIVEVPNDVIDVVPGSIQRADLATKLKELWISSSNEVAVLPTSSNMIGRKTVSVPRTLLLKTVNMLESVRSSFPKSVDFLAEMKGVLSQNADDNIKLSGGVISRFGFVIKEIENTEERLNQIVSAARMIMTPICCADAQSIPNDRLVKSVMDNEVSYLDSDFQTNNAHALSSQLVPSEVMDEAVAYGPKLLGIAGDVATDVKINMNPEEFKDEYSVNDVVQGGGYDLAIKGINSMFSHASLSSTPIELGIVYRYQNKYYIELEGEGISTAEITTIALADDATLAANLPAADATKFKACFKTVTTKVAVGGDGSSPIEVDSMIANTRMDKQDWIVKTPSSTFMSMFSTQNVGAGDEDLYMTAEHTYIPVVKFRKMVSLMNDEGLHQMEFHGIMSGKVYTTHELMAISDGLKNVWNKFKKLKLPSLDTVRKATELISYGLGVAGELAGKSSLVKASNILGVIGNGLGEIAAGFQPHTYAESSKLDASVVNHVAYNIIPNLADIGLQRVQEQKRSKTNVSRDLTTISRGIVTNAAHDSEKTRKLVVKRRGY